MDKKIVHYKIFKNDEELTQFQKEHGIGIISIVPFTQGMKLDYDTKDADAEISIGVFVVFYNKEN